MSLLRFVWGKLRGAKPEPKPALGSLVTLAEHLADMGFSCRPCEVHGDALHYQSACCSCRDNLRRLVDQAIHPGLVDQAVNDNDRPRGAA